MLRWLVALALLLLLLLASLTQAASVSAQPRDGAQPQVDAAQAHFDRAVEHYRAGEYTAAIAEYEAAYALRKAPALLYDIALAHDRADAHADALPYYREFLAAAPAAPNRLAVELRIAELEEAARTGQPAPSAPVDSVPLALDDDHVQGGRGGAGAHGVNPRRAAADDLRDWAPHPGRTTRIVGLAAGVIGVALVATAYAYASRAAGEADEVSRLSREGGAWGPYYQYQYDAWQSDRSTAAIFGVVGGAALAGGAAIWLLGWRMDRAAAVDFALAPAPHGGVTMALAWGF